MNDKRIAEIVDEEMIKQDAKKYRAMKKLSIPKKIAEELRDEEGVNHTSYELMVYDDGDWSEELQEWMEKTDQWWFIVDAYLAGKALGVELVSIEG